MTCGLACSCRITVDLIDFVMLSIGNIRREIIVGDLLK